jgi:hypothetical protein
LTLSSVIPGNAPILDPLVMWKLLDVSNISSLLDQNHNSQKLHMGMIQMVNEKTYRSTPWLIEPFTCYLCGHKFDSEYKHQRKVQTGSSFGRSFRSYFRVINLCPECNEIQIQRDRINNAIMAIAILTISVMAIAIGLSLVLN